MHYKNQIDTIFTTLENMRELINEETHPQQYDDIMTCMYNVQEIIDYGYTTEHLRGAYSNPVEEAMSQLFKANSIINSIK